MYFILHPFLSGNKLIKLNDGHNIIRLIFDSNKYKVQVPGSRVKTNLYKECVCARRLLSHGAGL